MKSRLTTLFCALIFTGCVLPIQYALAYDDGLPAVESRNTHDTDSDEVVSRHPDKPMQLLEEDHALQPSAPAAIPDTPAARLDQLQQQVQELQGKLEIQEHRFQELSKQTLDNYQDLDNRLKTVIAAQAAVKTETAVQPEPGKDNPATAVSVGTAVAETKTTVDDEKTLYHKAYSLAQAKQYDASVEAFSQLIKTYPNSTYTPTAYFWMGEIYIVKSKYDEATESFNQIVAHYPKSPKVSEALFKIGYIAYARGNNKLAIKHFTAVKNKYPGTSAAKQAEQYLRKLKPKK